MTVKNSLLDGIMRGIGLTLPGIAISLAILYRQQEFPITYQLMIAGIISLLLFSVVGYSIFHASLYAKFGRLALFLFVTWALIVAIGRILNTFDFITTTDQRTINTIASIIFSLILSYIAWWRPVLISIMNYLFPEDNPKHLASLRAQRQDIDAAIAKIEAKPTKTVEEQQQC